jgi:hypothetical protein
VATAGGRLAVNYWGVMATRRVARRSAASVSSARARVGIVLVVRCSLRAVAQLSDDLYPNPGIIPLPREIGSAAIAGTRHGWRRQQGKIDGDVIITAAAS